MALTAKQKQFVNEYLVDLNATRAYKAAGYSVRSDNAAGVEGHKLLKNPKIAEKIREAMEKREQRTEITQDMVLQRWWAIATADPNELTHLRRLCCRHCFGIGHEYQWIDEREYNTAVELAIEEAKARDKEPQIPSDAGGFGFDRSLRPHPKCPKCKGEGRPELHVADTKEVSAQARALYAGAKHTQAGVEIKMHDQVKALEIVTRHLGMLRDKVELTGDEGGPINIIFSNKIRKQ